MDSNYTADEIYSTVEFDVTTLPLDKPVLKKFFFNEVRIKHKIHNIRILFGASFVLCSCFTTGVARNFD